MGSSSIAHRFFVKHTEDFDLVLGTNFFAELPQILSLTLQAPYVFTWTMVTNGNLYRWSSLNTHRAT